MAILLVGAIFVGAVVAVPTMSRQNFLLIDQQQLKNTAINVLNAMLLGIGSPSDWGSEYPFNSNHVQTFGLARSAQSSQYVLDMNKVQRLIQESPYYINYSQVRNLLNLQGYGFTLSIFRPFNVSTDISWSNTAVRFAVSLARTEDGTPIPNGQVKASIIVTASKPNSEDPPLYMRYDNYNYLTNATGKCEGSVALTNVTSGYTVDYAVAVLTVTVSGMSTIVTAQKDTLAQNLLSINTYGNTVTLMYRNGSEALFSDGVRRVMEVMSYNIGDEIPSTIYTSADRNGDTITNGVGYVDWSRTLPGLTNIDPSLLLFVINAPNIKGTGTGRHLEVIVGPLNLLDNGKPLLFGISYPRPNVAVDLRRFVVISDMTFVFGFRLWRESS